MLTFAIRLKCFERGANSTQAPTKGLRPKGMRVNRQCSAPIQLIRDPITLNGLH